MKMTNITNMKMARAKRAKLLFFIVKYETLRRLCQHRCSGCSSSLIDHRRRLSKRDKNKKVTYESLGECFPDVFPTL